VGLGFGQIPRAWIFCFFVKAQAQAQFY
jgi:hypothetical protein